MGAQNVERRAGEKKAGEEMRRLDDLSDTQLGYLVIAVGIGIVVVAIAALAIGFLWPTP